MSLFKSRGFWKTTTDEDEQFDQNSLKVTRLNSDVDYLVTGSHAGVLRIFRPSTEVGQNGALSDFKPSDLLLEKHLDGPILQMGFGKLVSGSGEVHLAVLHPRNVCVYGLLSKEGTTDHGTQHSLRLMYENKLRRSAINFVVGPFGGSTNRDHICIQSLDGMLTFFEQESFSFCCFLPDFLLPGPLIYTSKQDVFVTGSSNWTITAWRYKDLFEIGQNSNQEDSSGKKPNDCWSLNLGESLIDMQVVKFLSTKESIVALGERNMYALSDTGRILFMKHFEYSPVCFTTYGLGMEDKIMSLVVSETSTLLIYENTTLKWSAQLPLLPISLSRAFLKQIRGAIATLTESGVLECCYLGTEPSLFVAPPITNRDIDFEKASEELANLSQKIKSSCFEGPRLEKAGVEKEMMLQVQVSNHIEDNEASQRFCEVTVIISPQSNLDDVQITMSVHKPLEVVPDVQNYNYLNEKASLTSRVYLKDYGVVCSLDLEVFVTYVTNLGIPRMITAMERLPLALALEPCQAQKESSYKIVLNLNQKSVPLNALFSEDSPFITSNSAAFKGISESSLPVTILLAKSSERYRLQSDSILPLTLVVEEVVYRLKKFYAKNKEFSISLGSSLPVTELLQYVNQHFEKRQHVKAWEHTLIQISAQFRLIEKRLISKMKAKNPTPLKKLELLLKDTFEEINDATEQLQNYRDNLIKARDELACVLNLILELVRLMDVPKEALEQVESALTPSVQDLDGQNWEDTLDASLCFLLRTALAKTEKDKLRAPHTSFEEIQEIAKVEKHLTQVLDRISKKGVVLETHFDKENAGENNVKDEAPPSNVVPIGSQIGQSSSRILSARKGLLLKRHKAEEDTLV